MFMGGPPPGLINALMRDMMGLADGDDDDDNGPRIISGGPGKPIVKKQTIRVSGGPMGMSMTVIGGDMDDDDDMGIPPEILEMMKMTEMMHDRSSFFGAPKKK